MAAEVAAVEAEDDWVACRCYKTVKESRTGKDPRNMWDSL